MLLVFGMVFCLFAFLLWCVCLFVELFIFYSIKKIFFLQFDPNYLHIPDNYFRLLR